MAAASARSSDIYELSYDPASHVRVNLDTYGSGEPDTIHSFLIPHAEIKENGYRKVITKYIREFITPFVRNAFDKHDALLEVSVDKRNGYVYDDDMTLVSYSIDKPLYKIPKEFADDLYETLEEAEKAYDDIYDNSGDSFLIVKPEYAYSILRPHKYNRHDNDCGLTNAFREEDFSGNVYLCEDKSKIPDYPITELMFESVCERLTKHILKLVMLPTTIDRYDGGISIVSIYTDGKPLNGVNVCDCH